MRRLLFENGLTLFFLAILLVRRQRELGSSHPSRTKTRGVEAMSRVPGGDVAPLRKLHRRTGDALRAGVVLYLGQRSHHADDRLYVMPVDRLWTA